jgi:hypothetical protein
VAGLYIQLAPVIHKSTTLSGNSIGGEPIKHKKMLLMNILPNKLKVHSQVFV